VSSFSQIAGADITVCYEYVASPTYWTDWLSASGTNVVGQIVSPGATIGVQYGGELYFAQTNNANNYWNYPSTYTSANVGNPPPYDIVAISGNSAVKTVTFLQAVTDPVMAIVSLGQPSISTSYSGDRNSKRMTPGRG